MIPYGRQDISQEDISAVVDVLQSDWLTQGPKLPEFEQAVANKVNAEYAVAVNSATSALHIACLALGLKSGDWLWTSPISFVASANCGLYCGANIDFIDICPLTYNLSVEALEKKLIEAEKVGRLPKIVIPVHLSGQSCDMEAIHKLAKQYSFKIIEDASHAIGGKFKGRYIGCCQYSDITVFSFHPVKIITTAEGGMALTNNHDIFEKLSLLRSHGITRDTRLMDQEPDGPWYYQQIDLGFNYRMTDLQAAIGISQLNRLDDFIACRHELAKRYDDLLADMPLLTPWQHSDTFSAYHLYIIRLKSNEISCSHREVFESLVANGIGVNLHYIPIYMQPYYKQFGFNQLKFPEANQYYSEALSLPIYSSLSFGEQEKVVVALEKALRLI